MRSVAMLTKFANERGAQVDVLHSEISELFQSRDRSPTWDDGPIIVPIESPRRISVTTSAGPTRAQSGERMRRIGVFTNLTKLIRRGAPAGGMWG